MDPTGFEPHLRLGQSAMFPLHHGPDASLGKSEEFDTSSCHKGLVSIPKRKQ